MKYYVPIEINNLKIIQDKLYGLFPKKGLFSNHIFYPKNISFLDIPELKTELDRLGWTDFIGGFAFFIQQKVDPHPHQDSGDYVYSFNIPVINCDNTFVNFYESSTNPVKKILPSGVNYYMYDKKNCVLTDTLELTSPHVIKIKEPHSVVNPNNTPRITFLMRLKRELNLDHLFIE